MKQKLLRTHPIAIYFYLYRFLYLLIIPLFRGLVAALTGGLLRWLSGAWVDLLFILLILLLAYQKWDHFKYYMDNSGIYYTTGIFYQQEITIPMGRICTLSIQQPFWMRPLRLVRLRLDTLALAPNKADLSMYLRKDEAERIMAMRRRPIEQRGKLRATCRPRILDIVFLSIFTSNSFIGILFISTFISQAGKILGEDLYALLTTLLRRIAVGLEPLTGLLALAFRLPPIAMGIAAVLLGGWLVAFLLTLLQTKNLTTSRTKDSLHITGGIITKKEYSVNFSDICFIDIRQSLLTRFLRLYSVFLDAIGTGKERSDIKAIIPFSTRRRCETQLSLLLPEYHSTPRSIRPNAGAIMKFLLDPLWPCLLIPGATLLLMWLLPAWTAFFRFAGLMLSFPAFWFLGVRLMDYFSSGISRAGDYFTLRYSELFYLHTVVFSWEKIAMLNLRQSILQRGDAKCDLKVCTRSEGHMVHHIRNLSWDQTAALFEAEDGLRLPPSLWDKALAFFQKLFHLKK